MLNSKEVSVYSKALYSVQISVTWNGKNDIFCRCEDGYKIHEVVMST